MPLCPHARTVFFGDLGENCSGLIEYFEVIPSSPKIKPRQNPAVSM
jgi:hypothetical protein